MMRALLRQAKPLANSDWPALHERDARAFGASRATLLERLAAEAPEYAWVAPEPRHPGTSELWNLKGYLLGRHGHVRDHLGPLVADSPETAECLLDACLTAHPDREFFIDAPDDNRAWRAQLSERGFVIERSFLRMHRGHLTAAGQQVYAIVGPEFG